MSTTVRQEQTKHTNLQSYNTGNFLSEGGRTNEKEHENTKIDQKIVF
jgi:hypothetical protein